jgi:hypothetical protein
MGGSFRHPSMDYGAVGLSISQTNLNGFPSQTNLNREPPEPIFSPEETVSSLMEARSMPKLMLLTVADKPKIAVELQVQCNELHRVDNWLNGTDGSLDGVYLQYEKEMMTEEGAAYIRELSQRYLVGIWGYSGKDPDDFNTFQWLVKEGNCTFVNTDLPKHFRKELFMKSSTS